MFIEVKLKQNNGTETILNVLCIVFKLLALGF